MGLDIFFTKKKTTEVAYFRKANFLVKFFVDECNFDVEHQTPLYIKKENCEELLKRCETVMELKSSCLCSIEEERTKAIAIVDNLLPTMEGFFFGSTDYDEYYFNKVEDTIQKLKEDIIPQFDNLADDEGIYFETWY